MRILFDQGTPVPLRAFLTGHSVRTVSEEQWSTLQNGELLTVAEAAGFDVLLTTDTSRAERDYRDTPIKVLETLWRRGVGGRKQSINPGTKLAGSPARGLCAMGCLGGEAGIRTLGTGFSPYNGLAKKTRAPATADLHHVRQRALWCATQSTAVTLSSPVPSIVPASSQNRASGANSSQKARLRKWLRRLDLLEKTKMADRLIDV